MVPRSLIPVLPFKITCHAFREDVLLVEVVGVHIFRRETGKQLTALNSKSENPFLLWPTTENREQNRTQTAILTETEEPKFAGTKTVNPIYYFKMAETAKPKSQCPCPE